MKTLKIQRVGGMLPALRPTATHEWAALNEAQQQAVQQWLAKASRVDRAAHAEAMSYVFTLEGEDKGDSPVKLSAAYADVPEALRVLLPAAGSAAASAKTDPKK